MFCFKCTFCILLSIIKSDGWAEPGCPHTSFAWTAVMFTSGAVLPPPAQQNQNIRGWVDMWSLSLSVWVCLCVSGLWPANLHFFVCECSRCDVWTLINPYNVFSASPPLQSTIPSIPSMVHVVAILSPLCLTSGVSDGVCCCDHIRPLSASSTGSRSISVLILNFF